MKATACFALLPAASILMAVHHVPRACGHTFNVVSEGGSSADDSESSSSSIGLNNIDNNLYSLPDALSRAGPGDVIVLANGTYTDRLGSYAAGEEGNPIRIVGEPGAVLQSTSPSVHIEHSWITLEGFTVDGEHGSTHEPDSFVNKCVEVIGLGQNETEALEGFVMKNMIVQNCGGECVRLKNFVVNANITNNIIQHCGIYDFEFPSNTTDGKNGEGVYIGTSSKQWTYGEDRCNGNFVSGNLIATYGNECVEMKEGSSGNIIENNVCSHQLDINSGCFGSRGDSNIFRFNNVSFCEGAGVRLGGWEIDGHQYGQNNSVYGNTIYHVDNGAISVNTSPQQAICDNICEDGSCDLRGDDDSLGDMDETWDMACPSEAFEHNGGVEDDDTAEEEREEGEEEEEKGEPTPSPVEATPSPVESTPSPVEQEDGASSESTDDDVDDDDDEDAATDDDSTGDDGGEDAGDDDDSSSDAASSDDDNQRRRLRGTAN